MEDTFDHSFLFCKNRYYPSAVKKCFFNICQVTLLVQFLDDAIEYAPEFCSFAIQTHANTAEFFRCCIEHSAEFIKHFSQHVENRFFEVSTSDHFCEGFICSSSFIIKPAENALDAFCELPDLNKLFT